MLFFKWHYLFLSDPSELLHGHPFSEDGNRPSSEQCTLSLTWYEGGSPETFSSKYNKNVLFIVSLSRVAVTGCQTHCKPSMQQRCWAHGRDKTALVHHYHKSLKWHICYCQLVFGEFRRLFHHTDENNSVTQIQNTHPPYILSLINRTKQDTFTVLLWQSRLHVLEQ